MFNLALFNYTYLILHGVIHGLPAAPPLPCKPSTRSPAGPDPAAPGASQSKVTTAEQGSELLFPHKTELIVHKVSYCELELF